MIPVAIALKDVSKDSGDVAANQIVVLVVLTEFVIVQMDTVHKAVM